MELNFGRYLHLLQEDREFARWYTELLSSVPIPAFFWEHPPLLRSSHADKPVEFVLVDAPMLDAMAQDEAPFRAYFKEDRIASFPSLGGDALLIAPSPAGESTDYAHLAAFLRTAGEDQVQALWREVGIHVAAELGERPLWLSTSGLGVAWLHIRLDSRPKYYQHQPYKRLS
ncbi:MAG: hypothetical protein R3192_08960 [Woeseiaceae bacterium]|nr:hypothetical protein [Woeseiaceae bacterium]